MTEKEINRNGLRLFGIDFSDEILDKIEDVEFKDGGKVSFKIKSKISKPLDWRFCYGSSINNK